MLPVLLLVAALGGPCVFDLPVDGPLVRDFAPSGPYGGHWGIDLGTPDGSPVRAPAPGVVTFSGEVAGRSSVTIHHGGSVRTSYSYLSLRAVATGDHVGRGQVIGGSGVDHGVAAVHFSVRIGARYIDPSGLGCAPTSPGPGVRLSPMGWSRVVGGSGLLS